MANENLVFLKCFFTNPSKVGAFFPSSRKLAEGLVGRATKEIKGSVRYLEVGAGSGALTGSIIQKMKKGDSLALVERDPLFCRLLREKFGHLPNVTIHEISILDFSETNFDCVISSLPLNSFSPEFVTQIFKKFESLVKKGGYLSYFEYRGFQKINRTLLRGDARAVHQKREGLKKQFLSQYCKEELKSWANFPPARIFHCQM